MKARIPSVDELTLDQRIGQALCFGWQGADADESRTIAAHALELVESLQVGSVVLMARNVNSAAPLQTRAMLEGLQSRSRIPLFIAIDQEGGSVNRFRAPLHEFPGNMALGAIACGEMGMAAGELYARRQAEAQARELLSVGVNWNFAPVLDVNSNSDNPIIGVRSYGEDPSLVARLGAAAIRGFQDSGVLACAKHFPGHGDTSVDSHLALPTISGDRARLDSVELPPFHAAILEGVGAIMTTHIVFPALDPAAPATISSAVLTDLLRRQMGYDGLVITDCLEMDAIAGTIGTSRGAVKALKGGADIVLACHTLETQRETVRAIREAVVDGELPMARLNEAATRVLAAKQRFLANTPHAQGEPWLDPAHDSLEREIADASITVVRNGGGIPMRKTSSILVVSMHPAADRLAPILVRESQGRCRVDRLLLGPNSTDDNSLERVDEYDRVVVLTSPRDPRYQQPIDQDQQARLVRLLRAAFDEFGVVVAAIREPYNIRAFDSVPTCVCTYGNNDCSLEALASALFGNHRATACLPVRI